MPASADAPRSSAEDATPAPRTPERRAPERRALEAFPQPPLRPTRYPVVLLHGFGALAALLPGGMLHAQALHLRAHGVAAYAPNVNPYDTVPVRAAVWAERLEVIRRETGAEKLNLIAFSTGGLDARHLATALGWADRLAAIVTVSTPHRGTPLAQFLLDHPRAVGRWAIGAMDRVGRRAFADAPPRAAEAVRTFTPAARAADPCAPIPGVYCASYAAAAGRGARVPIHPLLLPHHRIIYADAGPNDGFVPVESAWWGERLGILPADHGQLVGIELLPSKAFAAPDFYLSVAEHLRVRGF